MHRVLAYANAIGEHAGLRPIVFNAASSDTICKKVGEKIEQSGVQVSSR